MEAPLWEDRPHGVASIRGPVGGGQAPWCRRALEALLWEDGPHGVASIGGPVVGGRAPRCRQHPRPRWGRTGPVVSPSGGGPVGGGQAPWCRRAAEAPLWEDGPHGVTSISYPVRLLLICSDRWEIPALPRRSPLTQWLTSGSVVRVACEDCREACLSRAQFSHRHVWVALPCGVPLPSCSRGACPLTLSPPGKVP